MEIEQYNPEIHAVTIHGRLAMTIVVAADTEDLARDKAEAHLDAGRLFETMTNHVSIRPKEEWRATKVTNLDNARRSHRHRNIWL